MVLEEWLDFAKCTWKNGLGRMVGVVNLLPAGALVHSIILMLFFRGLLYVQSGFVTNGLPSLYTLLL